MSDAALIALGLCLTGAPALAAEEAVLTAPGEVQEVVVFGRGEAKIGVAHAASEGTISGSDMLVRPLLKTAELLEAVPGLIAQGASAEDACQETLLLLRDRADQFKDSSDNADFIARSWILRIACNVARFVLVH